MKTLRHFMERELTLRASKNNTAYMPINERRVKIVKEDSKEPRSLKRKWLTVINPGPIQLFERRGAEPVLCHSFKVCSKADWSPHVVNV
jgi:hypothetical protein